jgi:hypothetical protein
MKERRMKKDEKDSLTVYWAPAYTYNFEEEQDWNILYREPESLLSSLKNVKAKESKENSLLYCPAFTQMHKNTYVFSNSLESSFGYDNNTNELFSKKENFIGASIKRPPSLNSSLIISYNLKWIFFCEENVSIEVTPPYFNNFSYSNQGTFVPGSFNINTWFRSVNADFNMWENSTDFLIKKDDPIFYAKFTSEKNVILKRFAMNKELHRIYTSCVRYPDVFGRFNKLSDMYTDFKKSNTNLLVAKLVKENLV